MARENGRQLVIMIIDNNGDESTPPVAFNFTYDSNLEEDLIHGHFNGPKEPDESMSALTPDEKQLLEAYEQEIDAGVAGFYAVAKALYHIKTKKLYREEYRSFEAYCTKVHGFSRAHANRLLDAKTVVDNLKAHQIGDVFVPLNEGQARAFASLTLEEQVLVSEKLAATPKGKVTAKAIEKIKAEVLPDKAANPERAKGKPRDKHNVVQMPTSVNESSALVQLVDKVTLMVEIGAGKEQVIAGLAELRKEAVTVSNAATFRKEAA